MSNEELLYRTHVQKPLDDILERIARIEEELGVERGAEVPEEKPPFVPRPFPHPFCTSDAFVHVIESMFECRDGPYERTYAHEGRFYEYAELVAMVRADVSVPTEQLFNLMYDGFSRLYRSCEQKKPVLYWRFSAIERIQLDGEIDKSTGVGWVKMRTRVGIPAANFAAVGPIARSEGAKIFRLEEGSWPPRTAE